MARRWRAVRCRRWGICGAVARGHWQRCAVDHIWLVVADVVAVRERIVGHEFGLGLLRAGTVVAEWGIGCRVRRGIYMMGCMWWLHLREKE